MAADFPGFEKPYSRDKKYTAGAAINGEVKYTPAVGSPMEVLSLDVGIGGTKATAGVAVIQARNSADNAFARYVYDAAIIANELMSIPAEGQIQLTIAGANMVVSSVRAPIVRNPDYLFILVQNMANAELFTARLRALLHGPTVPVVTTITNLTEADE